MKLALLGADPLALQLVRAASQSKAHQIVAVSQAGPSYQQLDELAPRAVWNQPWEDLLYSNTFDALIVAASDDQAGRAEQLRKLVQAAVPMILVHPACESLIGYELDMIRRDTGCILVPYIPGWLHPAVQLLVQYAQNGGDSPLGTVQQVVIERTMQQCDRPSVLAQLTRDIALLRAVAGDFDSVSAMGPTDEQTSYANLTVNLSGSVLARWSASTQQDSPQGRLMLMGTTGKAVLTMPPRQRQWNLEITAGGRQDEQTFPDWDGPAAALGLLEKAMAGQPYRPDWNDACRDAEIADGLQRSLKRRRTIDLLHEEPTEEDTFKAVMAIGGCGSLMLTLLVVIFAAIAEGLRPSVTHQAWWRLWPIYLLAALGIFLLLQLLKLVFGKSASHDRPPARGLGNEDTLN